jgi:hypothetical protein
MEGNVFEIYFEDLNEEAQKRFIEFMGGDIGNFDIFPIGSIEIVEDDEEDNV